jgi:hypothetical protein
LSSTNNYSLVLAKLGLDSADGVGDDLLALRALLLQGRALDATSARAGRNFARDIYEKLQAYVPSSAYGRQLLQPLATLAERVSQGLD